MIKLSVVGDILLTRNIGSAIDKYGFEFLFSDVKPIFNDSDIVFGNLECSLTQRGVPLPGYDPNVTFRAKPELIKGLKKVGFSVLSIANNHIYDYGHIGLMDTIDAFNNEKIGYIGAGKTSVEAKKPYIIEKKGLKIGFLAYHQLLGRSVRRVVSKKSVFAQLIVKECCNSIINLKKKVDIVIVSIHWGIDYARYPSPCDIDIARQFVSSGCDLILGHHAHVIQGWERYKNGYKGFKTKHVC